MDGHRDRPRRLRRLAAAGAAAALTAGAAIALGAGPAAVDYTDATGAALTGLRPTGVGLPLIGESGTVGAGEFGSALRTYHDSGAYDRDLAAVAGAAQAYLDQRLTRGGRKTGRKCAVRYRRVTARGAHGPLYRRSRTCRAFAPVPALHGRPAIVLDIDETSLSNYGPLSSSNFSSSGLAAAAVAGQDPAIAPTLALYRDARKRGVAVFFITGRPAGIDSITQANLRAAGYTQGWNGIQEKPSGTTTKAFKSSARAKVEKQGFDIVVNLGDQESDLDGGHADRAFKLPNPFYFIPD